MRASVRLRIIGCPCVCGVDTITVGVRSDFLRDFFSPSTWIA